MLASIKFSNFKVLRDAELKLGPLNILVGPNGSGKSTVFKALESIQNLGNVARERLCTIGTGSDAQVEVTTRWQHGKEDIVAFTVSWLGNGIQVKNNQKIVNPGQAKRWFQSSRIFAFDSSKVAATVQLEPNATLAKDGANLASALDGLRDKSEEAFEALKDDLRLWLPEFDSITFETPSPGRRSFKLRQSVGKQSIASTDLSEGTLTALALLYLAHDPDHPSIICLEEPDRGLHPRLLRDVRDALYRLSYPEQFGLKSSPVQVIATTHSPYFLDLFKDHPEEIIIAEKQADATAKFKRLADDPELIEIIGDAPLGEVWYTGILGGVPIRK